LFADREPLMSRAAAIIVVLAIAGATVTAQQRATSPPLTISGRVIAAGTDQPLRRARISTSTGDFDRSVLTDDEGRFDFAIRDTLQPLLVTKAGYASTVVDLRRNKPVSDRPIEVRLSKSAAISGRVTDQNGTPVAGLQVVARRVDGTDAKGIAMLQNDTDDRGEYRLGGLGAGKYGLSLGSVRFSNPDDLAASSDAWGAGPPAGMALMLGARAAADAPALASVDLHPGDDLDGVDLAISVMKARDRADVKAILEHRRDQMPRGRIAGVVVATNGDVIAGAEVRATRTGAVATLQGVATITVGFATTDAAGRFSVGLLDDGEYKVEARQVAHVAADDRPLSEPRSTQQVKVSKGVADDVRLALARGGVVSGTIVDAAGEPLQGVRVRALRLRSENGQFVAVPAGWDRSTDERGRYRLFGLPSGLYVVAASLNADASGADRAQHRGFAVTYSPGTTSLESAQTLRVQAGAEFSAVDVAIAPTFTARVTGRAFDSGGDPMVGRVHLMISRHASAVTTEPVTTPVNDDGTFELTGVTPGTYVLHAIGEGGFGRGPQFGVASVVVEDRDPAAVTVQTSPGTTLEGRFIVEGTDDPPLRALAIHASATDLDRGPRAGRGPSGLAVHDDGRFYLTGLHGPMRFSATSLPDGWYLKSVTIAGADVTDVPFDFGSVAQTLEGAEIVLSTKGATIAGVATDGPNTPASNFVAVAFSTSRESWTNGSRQVKQQRSDGNGSFKIEGLPPGDYWVAAVDRLEPGNWLTPDNLDALVPGSARVTVREGQVLSTDLRLLRGAP
jgi:Carboxypeptidase regulatory-like domain